MRQLLRSSIAVSALMIGLSAGAMAAGTASPAAPHAGTVPSTGASPAVTGTVQTQRPAVSATTTPAAPRAGIAPTTGAAPAVTGTVQTQHPAVSTNGNQVQRPAAVSGTQAARPATPAIPSGSVTTPRVDARPSVAPSASVPSVTPRAEVRPVTPQASGPATISPAAPRVN
ncbi:MAG: hypothetical protein JWO24_2395 [Rhodospirillales bacterium]|jgi:hypothetical protein|nr:hypothetical protein [Rhodospirillales bacterium]